MDLIDLITTIHIILISESLTYASSLAFFSFSSFSLAFCFSFSFSSFSFCFFSFLSFFSSFSFLRRTAISFHQNMCPGGGHHLEEKLTPSSPSFLSSPFSSSFFPPCKTTFKQRKMKRSFCDQRFGSVWTPVTLKFCLTGSEDGVCLTRLPRCCCCC